MSTQYTESPYLFDMNNKLKTLIEHELFNVYSRSSYKKFFGSDLYL